MNYRQTRRPTGRRTTVVEWWCTRALQDSAWRDERFKRRFYLDLALYLRSRYFQTWWKIRGSMGFFLFFCSRKIQKCKRRWTRGGRLFWWNGIRKKKKEKRKTLKRNRKYNPTCDNSSWCLGLIFETIRDLKDSHKTIEEFETREHPEILREPRQNVTNTVSQVAVKENGPPAFDIGDVAP